MALVEARVLDHIIVGALNTMCFAARGSCEPSPGIVRPRLYRSFRMPLHFWFSRFAALTCAALRTHRLPETLAGLSFGESDSTSKLYTLRADTFSVALKGIA